MGVAFFLDPDSDAGDDFDCVINECDAEITGGPRFVVLGWEAPRSSWRFDATAEFIFRTDVEDLSVEPADGDPAGRFDSNIRNWTAMGHAFYALPLSERWGLYGGFGVGLTYYKSEAGDGDGDFDGLNPALRLQGGVEYALSDNWLLEIGASATSLGEVEVASSRTAPGIDAEIGRVLLLEVLTGVRYRW